MEDVLSLFVLTSTPRTVPLPFGWSERFSITNKSKSNVLCKIKKINVSTKWLVVQMRSRSSFTPQEHPIQLGNAVKERGLLCELSEISSTRVRLLNVFSLQTSTKVAQLMLCHIHTNES